MTKSRDSVFERPFGCDQIKETVSSSYVGSARPVPHERRGDGIVLIAEVRHLRPGPHRPKVARADLSARSLLALLEAPAIIPGKNGGEMGEIQPKKCEGRELIKDQLAAAAVTVAATHAAQRCVCSRRPRSLSDGNFC